MVHTTISRKNKFYAKALAAFRRQFKDIDSLTEVYVNTDNKVYAAQWLDNAGIINFNGGWAADCVKVVKFIN